eukprot:CAMPEP_0203906848 /NCGR_PEP_ID=MMETSP0359-20131031/48421_1 /ASSEMBLY_ACC=CAM_ASM_000338 /TAXON_ID=268821 /ORGANISM="Scrippsiella Hangoei, Strain SHTV-5" /LENGTH=316 /DNA_ID=CAMNT_0050831561 /DNA_START=65 /DNA_END=1015 /DNA_ORIENTATION=-
MLPCPLVHPAGQGIPWIGDEEEQERSGENASSNSVPSSTSNEESARTVAAMPLVRKHRLVVEAEDAHVPLSRLGMPSESSSPMACRCGHLVKPTDNFCRNCGSPTGQKQPEALCQMLEDCSSNTASSSSSTNGEKRSQPLSAKCGGGFGGALAVARAVQHSSASSASGVGGAPKAQEDDGAAARLISVGSVRHEAGSCKPCLFYVAEDGCSMGFECNFCHETHKKKTRPRPSKVARAKCKRMVAEVEDYLKTRQQGQTAEDQTIIEAVDKHSPYSASYLKMMLRGKVDKFRELEQQVREHAPEDGSAKPVGHSVSL